jgi:hypothetical protein
VPILLGSFIVSSIVPACSNQMFVTVPERLARRVMRPRARPVRRVKGATSTPRIRGAGVNMGIGSLLGAQIPEQPGRYTNKTNDPPLFRQFCRNCSMSAQTHPEARQSVQIAAPLLYTAGRLA